MFTQPRVSHFVQGGGVRPIPPNLWKYICGQAEASAILARVRELVPNAVLIDGNEEWFAGDLIYRTDFQKAWSVQGSITDTSGQQSVTLTLFDSAAWLFDRMTAPDGEVDKNPDTTVGGPKLSYVNIGNNTIELRWGK